MRRRGRTDGNHSDIVLALRACGASVLSLANVGQGCPDLLIGFRGRNLLAEVKDGNLPPSRRQLTRDELVFKRNWCGAVVVIETIEQALDLLGGETANVSRENAGRC